MTEKEFLRLFRVGKRCDVKPGEWFFYAGMLSEPRSPAQVPTQSLLVVRYRAVRPDHPLLTNGNVPEAMARLQRHHTNYPVVSHERYNDATDWVWIWKGEGPSKGKQPSPGAVARAAAALCNFTGK